VTSSIAVFEDAIRVNQRIW